MAYRFTDTAKWGDTWFLDLKPIHKLMFLYLCDQCDIAGFVEFNERKFAFDLGTDKQAVNGALEGLEKGIVFSTDRKLIFVKNFIKHQKNLPLKAEIKVRASIIEKLKEKVRFFNLLNFNDFLTLSQPLQEGYGNSNSNIDSIEDKGGVGEKEEKKDWKKDYEIYLSDLREAFELITVDPDWLNKQERYHPNLDIRLSIEKACVNFWSKEAGWKKKKWAKIENIDWRSTFTNALDLKMNQVYKSK